MAHHFSFTWPPNKKSIFPHFRSRKHTFLLNNLNRKPFFIVNDIVNHALELKTFVLFPMLMIFHGFYAIGQHRCSTSSGFSKTCQCDKCGCFISIKYNRFSVYCGHFQFCAECKKEQLRSKKTIKNDSNVSHLFAFTAKCTQFDNCRTKLFILIRILYVTIIFPLK